MTDKYQKALKRIVTLYTGMTADDLYLAEAVALNIALEALGWTRTVDENGEIKS